MNLFLSLRPRIDVLYQLAQASTTDATGIEWIDVIERAGVAGVLIMFLVGGYRGWWVYGRQHNEAMEAWKARFEEMKEDRDYWRDVAVQGVQTAKEGLSLAETRLPRR